MRFTLWRAAALTAVLALTLTACGGDDGGTTDDTTDTGDDGAGAEDAGDGTGDNAGDDGTSGGDMAVPDGPAITVGSFNFGESQILGNIYAIAMEDAGYEVETKLDLGAREVILPELESGNLDFLPEYAGSALSVGFGGEPTGDLEATVSAVTDAFAEIGVTVLEPAPGQDANAFAVTAAFAEENGLTTIGDLAGVDGTITFAGPPECEERDTCLLALTETYGLDNIEFEAIQEGSVRVASLRDGAVDVALLFSTQPVIATEGFVTLEDPEGAIPVENILPVVSDEVIDAYGQDLVDLINSISAEITTDVLIELNGKVELDAEDPEDVAREWLEANGLAG